MSHPRTSQPDALVRTSSMTSESGARGSITGKTRNSVQGGPRSSVTGGKKSHRNNSRRSTRNGMGGDGMQLQVIDDDGTDRTPKPLMALNPSVLRGAGLHDKDSDAASDVTSEFFLDRMSDTNFSKAGWMSGTTSGSATPKSDAEEEGQVKAVEGETAAAPDETEVHAEVHEEEVVAEPELLTERDLDRSVYISLQETPTFFMLSVPCVTVALDSDEARLVEEANKRYAALLTVKQAADRFVDAEVQTLDLLKKSREVQSSVYAVADTQCQAATWDIADTYARLEEESIESDEPTAGLGPGQSVGQMAGAVGRGGKYSSGMGDGRSSTGNGGGSRRDTMQSTVNGGATRESTMSGQSSFAPAAGLASGVSAPADPNLPEGIPLDAADSSKDSELEQLPGLLEALQLMDAACAQNLYQARLLLYRGIQQLAHRPPDTPPEQIKAPDAMASKMSDKVRGEGERGEEGEEGRGEGACQEAMASKMSDKVRPYSRSVSRAPSVTAGLSRQGSELSMQAESVYSRAPAMSVVGGIRDVGGSVTSGTMQHPAAPASIAESMWPEDLLQDLADLGPDGVPRIEHLWDWKCPLTTGAKVSCMAWNKKHQDLLAVGYGNNSFHAQTEGSSSQKGLVAFWSLKNPGYPLWYFETATGVTALDFATHSPNILAVGLYSGTVAIYDVKRRQGSPAMESDASNGRHADPVWKVKWIDRGHERDEPLVSISTDGRVTQWSIAKGLEFVDLMKLKRIPRKPMEGPASAASNGATANGTAGKSAAAAAGEHDAFISRLTSGMSFDFSGRDERIYIAGTEDGWIHRCSTSYSEQYLESYQGHMGPVYNVQWSPFRRDMFVSASGDWTLRLWQEGHENALLLFQSSNQEVNDVQWCPTNATVFADVTSGGRLELWDFELSTVKPVVTHKAGIALSCLLFSKHSPVVVCGGEDGVVSVFRTYNIEREYDTMEEQLSRLDETIRANVMKQQPGQMTATL